MNTFRDGFQAAMIYTAFYPLHAVIIMVFLVAAGFVIGYGWSKQ